MDTRYKYIKSKNKINTVHYVSIASVSSNVSSRFMFQRITQNRVKIQLARIGDC